MLEASTPRACGLAFLTAAVTLFTQVLVHRIVSAKLVNNYAFLVISLTMLGFAVSGVILSRWLDRFLESFHEALNGCAALFVVSLLGSALVFYHASASTGPLTRETFVKAFLTLMPTALLFAVPFLFCGLVLGALLSAPQLPTRRVYFSDLAGSAAGAFSVVGAIGRIGVELSLIGACAAMLGGTLVLAPPRGRATRLLAGTAALVTALAFVTRDRFFDMRYPPGSMLEEVQSKGGPYGIERVLWDPVARIEVARIPPPEPSAVAYPSLIGSNPRFLGRLERLLTQNNFAFTYAPRYDGSRDSLEGIEETLYAAAYEATSVRAPRVAVIGVGGGLDVLAAIRYGASQIVGVEVNAATLKVLTEIDREYFRRWLEDPRVSLVLAEGRHYLATTPEAFDIVQLSGVDSYSGTPGAAHVFSENYLYTSEAFDLYLSRLSENGILNMMRLESVPPTQMLRALTTAVAALRRAGVRRPAEHIVMLSASDGHFAAMLVKRTPFAEAEQRRLGAWASRSRYFGISVAPGVNSRLENLYQVFLALADPRRERAFVGTYAFDVSPVDDDRPFFFKHTGWGHLFPSNPYARQGVPVMEYSILLLLAVVGSAAALCVLVPLRFLASRGATSGAWRHAVFFGGTGLGYLAIEIAFLQKFGLFLGHPNYALSVVLAALLLATGLGSLYSEALVKSLGNLRFASYALAALVLALHVLVFPRLLRLLELPFALRCCLAFALVAPVGVCLGVFLPSALERLKKTSPLFVPWAWGINGIFSVLSPIVSVGVSMTWGASALLLAAIPVYLAVGFSLPEGGEL